MSEQAFDIAVIGAGIAGASVAAELARTHSVVLLEREDFPGYHSTGRSAALFSEIYGNPVVRALSRAGRAFFHDPPAGFATQPLIRPRGALHIATEANRAQLQEFAANKDVAAAVRNLSHEEALQACPVLRPEHVRAAVLEPDAADVDVNELHQGYLREFRGAGGVLNTNFQVLSLSRIDSHWRIGNACESLRAEVIVNAAGAWADAIAAMAGAMPLGIQPCRRTAILIELPNSISADAWPMVIDADESFYMKPDAGLLLISPADETPVDACDVQPEELDIAIAIDRVETATTLKVSRIRKRWAGLRSFARDRSPVIGFDATAPGFFWLAGQGGYGIQTAPAASWLAAALIREEAPPIPISDPSLLVQLSPRRFATQKLMRSPA